MDFSCNKCRNFSLLQIISFANAFLRALRLISALLIITFILNSCNKEPEVPILSTSNPTNIARTTVTVGGNITSDGGSAVIERGICWSTTNNPDFTDMFITAGEGTGIFSSSINGLIPDTLYYVRAYATNSVGTAFGNEVYFKTASIVTGSITTIFPSSISKTTAVSGGIITLDGGGPITKRGICWSKLPEPDITDFCSENGADTGKFVSNMTNLSPGTKYYVRAYAINSTGIAYGNQICFNTKIADIQGNLYNTVTIGSQVWMAENLRTTRFNNNNSIPNITSDSGWINLNGPGYCWYNNDISYKPTFGALYSWYTVNTGLLCPSGWHVPSDEEFNALEISLGINAEEVDLWGWRGTDQGDQMKSTSGWIKDGNGTNSSGFNGLSGGYLQGSTGNSYGIGTITYWWSSTDDSANGKPNVAWYRRLDGANSDVYKATTYKNGGKYVRCVKNE